MSVRFILGRAGTGKTHYCVSAAIEALKGKGNQRLLFLAPEQATFQIEQAIALRSAEHGYWRLDVLGFSRLAQQILAEVHTKVVISTDTRRLALRLVVQQESESLRCFGPAAATAGFFVHLERFMVRCRQDAITPGQLLETAQKLGDPAAGARLAALGRCCAAYEAWLGPERMDAAQRLDVVLPLVEQMQRLRGARLWVDGFAGFTMQEMKLMIELCRVAEATEITLLLDPNAAGAAPGGVPDGLSLFQRTEQTYRRLRDALAGVGVAAHEPVKLTAPRRFAGAWPLSRLEAALALPFGVPTGVATVGETRSPDGVRVLACPTLRDEVREAAAWIRRAVVEGGGRVRYRDFAVIARDLRPMAGLVREILREHEIPYFLDQRRSLRSHGLGRFVAALGDGIETDGGRESMGRLLRSELLPLERDDCERIENQILKDEIDGLAAWRGGLGLPGSAGATARAIGTVLGETAAILKAGRRCAAREWADRWAKLLDELRVADAIERWGADARKRGQPDAAETHRQAWETLVATLSGLRELGDERPIGWREAREALESALREATVGLTPPTLDQVLVSSIDRSRHPDIKRAWLLSFNAGVFPAPPDDEPLIGLETQREMARLGLDVFGPERDDLFGERLLAYIALTRASQELTISFATHAADGDELQPSPLLADVKRALPGLQEVKVLEPTCATVSELARRAQGSVAAEFGSALLGAVGRDPALGPRLRQAQRGREFRNETVALAGALRDPTWDDKLAWCGSPSDLEDYLQCPFQYFAKRTLRLRQRGPTPAVQRIGSAFHSVLAQVVRRAIDAGRSVREISEAEWTAWFEEATGEMTAAAQSPQARFEVQSAKELLRGVLQVHWERWRRGQFEPLAVEQRFGPPRSRPAEESNWPALVFESAGGRRIEILGCIDRVDICRAERPPRLLVYDYKSTVGIGGFNKPTLLGETLQLFLYLAAAVAAAKAQGAGVLLAPLFPAIGEAGAADDDSTVEARLDEQLEALLPRGRFSANVVKWLDERVEKTNASRVARIKVRKDGGYDARCDVTDVQQLDARLEQAAKTVTYAVAALAAGDASIAPLLDQDRLPCNQCEFGDVCRIERADAGQAAKIRRADMVLPQAGRALAEGDDS